MRIDFATATEMILNYKNHQWQTLNNNCKALQNADGTTKVDTRSVWFDLAELQKYLTQIQNAGGNGVRIYFGAYDDEVIGDAITVLKNSDPAFIPAISQYSGMQTLIMVPTTNSNGLNTDFSLDPQVQDFDDSSSLILSCENHGSMAPPPPLPAATPFAAVDGTFYMDNCGAYFLDL